MFRYVIQLPFRLRISKDQTFRLPGVEASVVLRFFTPPPKEGEPLQNTMLLMDSNRSMEVDPYWSLEAYSHVNNIIRAYQVVTGDIFNGGIINQLTWNQFSTTTVIIEFDEQGKAKEPSKTLYFSLGIGADPIAKTEYEEIKSLAESPSLMSKRSLDEFLIRAKIFQEQHNFHLALLESVIALEFALYSIVRNWAKREGLTKEATELLIDSLGISKILEALAKYTDKPPETDIISTCRRANRIRNKIVHEAYLTVTAEESRQALMSVESLINHCRPAN